MRCVVREGFAAPARPQASPSADFRGLWEDRIRFCLVLGWVLGWVFFWRPILIIWGFYLGLCGLEDTLGHVEVYRYTYQAA